MRPLSHTCARIAGSSRFQNVIMAVIFANAVVLGLQTYDRLEASIGGLLATLDSIFLGVFVVEIAIRVAAYGRRPWQFFGNGWNVFDFVVIGAAFAPWLRENVTLLRIVRLLRVVRLVGVLPDMRILLRGMVRSLLPIGTMAILGVLLMYVYGMVGWMLFAESIPERWGTIGDAMLNLFVVMTLEEFPVLMREGMDVYPAAWLFFVSYVLLASFLIVNVLIAIIINSIEEARKDHRLDSLLGAGRDDLAAGLDAGASTGARERAAARVHALREALDDLEAELDVGGRPATMASKGRLRP